MNGGTFVLILALFHGDFSSEPKGVTAVEFGSKAACEAAAKEASAKFSGHVSSVYYVCVPKG